MSIELQVARYRVMLLKVYLEYGYYNEAEFEAKVAKFKEKLEKESK